MKINTHSRLPDEYDRGYLHSLFLKIDDAIGKMSSGTLSDGDKGDITVSSSGAAWTIDNDVVTFAKMQNVTAPMLSGRATAGTGDLEAITLGTNLSFTGTTLNAAGGGTLSDGDYGDVTVSGTGTVITIDNDVVTFAKMQNITTDRLLGRDTAGTGDVEQLTATGGIEFTGSVGIQTSAFTGDVTKAAGGTALTIANDAVTYAKLQNLTTARLLGRATAGTGDAEEITLGTNLSFSGTTLNGGVQTITLTSDVTGSGTGTFATTIANDAVTYAKMQNVSATSRALGRKTAGAGDPEELTLSELLDFIGSAAQGDILYRGASTWARLAAGTSGYFLKTLGAAANPLWAAATATAVMTVNNQSANYTCVLADANNVVRHPPTDATARTFTIPAQASVVYPIGTTLTFRVAPTSGVITLAITTDTLYIAGNSSTGSRTLVAGSIATALLEDVVSGVGYWVISGTGIT